MNVVTLIGNLATDVELRDVGEELQVASFLLAVDRPGKDEADFVRVSTWNKQAELCAQYLAKGRKVGVDGRLRSSSWEDSDGKKRSSVQVEGIPSATPTVCGGKLFVGAGFAVFGVEKTED